MKERRRYRRVEIEIRVIYKVFGVKGEKETRSLNIGGGGVCLPVDQQMSLGTLLELGLFLPGDIMPIFALGRVVWQAGSVKMIKNRGIYFPTGIEFLKMNVEDRNRIIKYVYKIYQRRKGLNAEKQKKSKKEKV